MLTVNSYEEALVYGNINPAINMNKVVVKATELYCSVDVIFRATDGNMYYIPGGRETIAKDLFGSEDCIYSLNDTNMLEWVNDNPKEWELDVE